MPFASSFDPVPIYNPSGFAPQPVIDPFATLPAVELTSELKSALRALTGFRLPGGYSSGPETSAPTNASLNELRTLLSMDDQMASAIGFLNSCSSPTLARQSPGKAVALALAMSEVELKSPEPFLHGLLNLLSGSPNPDEALIHITGTELLKTSRTAECGAAHVEAKKTLVEHALYIFCDLTCYSLKHSPELGNWIAFFNLELNKEQTKELVSILATGLNTKNILSGYEHILAVIKGSPHRESALQFADSISRATISREEDPALSEAEKKKLAEPAPIAFTPIAQAIAVSAIISIAATGSLPGYGFALGAGILLLARRYYNSVILPTIIEHHNNPAPITDPRTISWNVFYEKLRQN